MPLSHCHVCGDSLCHALSGVLRRFTRSRLACLRFATVPSMRPVVRTCKVCHDSNAMMTCHHCDRVLVYGWLRAVRHDGRRYEMPGIRVCSVQCAETLGYLDGMAEAWMYEPASERERRTA